MLIKANSLRIHGDCDRDPELTFTLHVKTVAARCFHHLRQLWTIWRALSDNNARMLVHTLISNRVDYCNSILHRVAAVHLRPFQSMLNAAALADCQKVEVRPHYADFA